MEVYDLLARIKFCDLDDTKSCIMNMKYVVMNMKYIWCRVKFVNEIDGHNFLDEFEVIMLYYFSSSNIRQKLITGLTDSAIDFDYFFIEIDFDYRRAALY